MPDKVIIITVFPGTKHFLRTTNEGGIVSYISILFPLWLKDEEKVKRVNLK